MVYLDGSRLVKSSGFILVSTMKLYSKASGYGNAEFVLYLSLFYLIMVTNLCRWVFRWTNILSKCCSKSDSVLYTASS